MDRDAIGKIMAESLRARRGYADFFDWPDKSMKEWGVAQNFLEELERNWGLMIVSGRQHPGGKNHAPDWQVTTAMGEVWGVELTELVRQKAIEGTKRGKLIFAVWPDDELAAKFQALVAGKDRPEKVRGGPYDRYVLLVHVDEDMLPAERLAVALDGCHFETSLIDDIYVLVSYDPKEGHCPLLRFGTAKTKHQRQSGLTDDLALDDDIIDDERFREKFDTFDGKVGRGC